MFRLAIEKTVKLCIIGKNGKNRQFNVEYIFHPDLTELLSAIFMIMESIILCLFTQHDALVWNNILVMINDYKFWTISAITISKNY